jgi:type VI secretion system protein ImpA
MGAEATLDLESLLAPVSESSPTGVDLRSDLSDNLVFVEIKDARDAARRIETRGEETGWPRQWWTVSSEALKSLALSKDLRIASWLIEAQLRINGFAGLRDGLRLATGLVTRYWDSFHPIPGEDGTKERLLALASLDRSGSSEGALIAPLRLTSITPDQDRRGYGLMDYTQAWDLERVTDPETRARQLARGAVNLEQFNAAAAAGGTAYYAALVGDIEGAREAYDALIQALRERAGADAPSGRYIRDLLETIHTTALEVAKPYLSAAAPALANETPASAASDRPATSAPLKQAAVHDREDALQQLLRVAEYFRLNEPQSPISAMLEETVRRARLSFADLLTDILPDAAARRLALANAGIKPPPEVT